jgi:hypothetical protein
MFIDVLNMRDMESFVVQQLKHIPGLRLLMELEDLETQKEFDDAKAHTLVKLIAVDILVYASAVVLRAD